MRVLGISGSPRIGGNTEILLDKALEGAKSQGAETEKIILNNFQMSSCQECEDIPDDGTCKIQDDFQGLYEKIMKADTIILAAPIFFGSLSAQTKIMIDRFQCSWRFKYILKKPVTGRQKQGALILVEASKKDSFLENARSIVKNFFETTDIEYKKELFCQGIDGKGAILGHPDYLEKAYNLAKELSC